MKVRTAAEVAEVSAIRTGEWRDEGAEVDVGSEANGFQERAGDAGAEEEEAADDIVVSAGEEELEKIEGRAEASEEPVRDNDDDESESGDGALIAGVAVSDDAHGDADEEKAARIACSSWCASGGGVLFFDPPTVPPPVSPANQPLPPPSDADDRDTESPGS